MKRILFAVVIALARWSDACALDAMLFRDPVQPVDVRVSHTVDQ